MPTRTFVTRCTAAAALTATVLWLGGCATPAVDSVSDLDAGAPPPGAQQIAQALQAIADGRGERALDVAQRWVLQDPASAAGHLLLAGAHHLAGDPASAELASSGYGAARRLGGAAFWPDYLAGVSAFQRNRMELALAHFSDATLAQPDQPWALEGVAAAAYSSGRPELASAAARRALALDPRSSLAWQAALLAAAAAGDEPRSAHLLNAAPEGVDAAQRRWASERAALLLRTAAVDADLTRVAASAVPTPGSAGPEPAPVGGEGARHQQLTVDVTLILADGRRSRAYGVNLLDGLQIQFGASRIHSSTRSLSAMTDETAITRAIRLPDLTYNLNVFNRGNRSYEVMARPSLTAFAGQQSTFFVGEQVFVQVSGVNTAALEKVDVGITLKITPSEVRPDGARFRVEADRSFFSDAGAGSFKEQLATFKQSVAATADIRFGETLVLSGLSETVRDGQQSRVPGLGDIPGPDLLFSRRTLLERTRSVIILVTPSQPLGIARTASRNAAVERLIALWDEVIEPRHGAPALVDRLRNARGFSRAAAGDVGVRDLSEPSLRRAFAAALRQPLSRPVAREADETAPPAATRPTSASKGAPS